MIFTTSEFQDFFLEVNLLQQLMDLQWLVFNGYLLYWTSGTEQLSYDVYALMIGTLGQKK